MKTLFGLLLALPCAGCFTLSTAQVTVRDTTQVTLEKESGEPVLKAAPGPERGATITTGSYWRFFDKIPYEVWGERDNAGGMTLQCVACTEYGHGEIAIATPDGKLRETYGWNIDIGTDKVTTKLDECMVSGSHGMCNARVQANLVAPMSDVIEVRRKQTPIRFIGWMFAVIGGAALTAATVYALTPPRGETVGDRAPFAAIAGTPFAFALGLGLWEILAPAHETVWHPSPANQ